MARTTGCSLTVRLDAEAAVALDGLARGRSRGAAIRDAILLAARMTPVLARLDRIEARFDRLEARPAGVVVAHAGPAGADAAAGDVAAPKAGALEGGPVEPADLAEARRKLFAAFGGEEG